MEHSGFESHNSLAHLHAAKLPIIIRRYDRKLEIQSDVLA